ncbi:hypothetical protein TSUD_390810 [Trifolium subterraneum]|uniref:Protein NO VEIN C-terminal domain-containing protein n=1 Tax=Trifolium subterraneum TaxID=3900 RepID=A0A2Z6MG30_TRISU|nr:hypothetical protein TSUD_390810 [Trifolium subterraneum]
MEPEYDAELNYQKFNKDHCHWTSGAKYEMTFELIEEKSILKKARIAEALIFAVNHRDPNKLVLFDKGSPTKSGKLKFWHNQVGQPGNGFFDSNGNILLRVQLQLLPYDPDREETSFHSLHRQFRLQLYWIKKKVIDRSFSKVFASHTTYIEKESRSADWESYLKDSSQELRWKQLTITYRVLLLTLHDSFLKFRKQTGQQTNQETEHVPAPGVDSGGSAKIEHVSAPADSVGCSETKADVPDKGGSAADIMKTKLVWTLKNYTMSNVQENALEVFIQEVNNSRIDDHKFDVQSIKFKPKPTRGVNLVSLHLAKIKDDTELEAEARRIGRLGEKYAYEYYKDKYNNVLWVNENDELFQPFDLTGFDKKNNSKFFIEAKATIHKRKKWFHISPAEYDWAMMKQSNYIIAHVYIDEKEGAEPKFTVTEFINPIRRHNSLLKLCMRYK